MSSKKEELFKGNIQELIALKNSKAVEFTVEVSTIISTWIELLSDYASAVSKLDMEVIADFFDKKSRDLSLLLKNRYGEANGIIRYEEDPSYAFYYHSITIFLGSKQLLYPFMLIVASNYEGFIQLLASEIKKSKEKILNLVRFLNIFYSLYRRGIPRLAKKDWDSLKEITRSQSISRSEYIKKIQEIGYGRSKRLWKLGILKVHQHYFAINFPALGYIPYMQLDLQRKGILKEIRPFVELEVNVNRKRSDFDFRIIMIPHVWETKWVEQLSKGGLINKIKDIRTIINWNKLYQTSKNTWKWSINYQENSVGENSAVDRAINSLYFDVEEIQGLKTGFIEFIDSVSHLGFISSKELATVTRLSNKTVRNYLSFAQDRKIIVPVWNITRIGLDNYLQVILANEIENHLIMKKLEDLPKVWVVKSEKFCRYLLFLPTRSSIKKISSLVKSNCKQGKNGVSYCCEIKDNNFVITRGVKLATTWDMIKN